MGGPPMCKAPGPLRGFDNESREVGRGTPQAGGTALARPSEALRAAPHSSPPPQPACLVLVVHPLQLLQDVLVLVTAVRCSRGQPPGHAGSPRPCIPPAAGCRLPTPTAQAHAGGQLGGAGCLAGAMLAGGDPLPGPPEPRRRRQATAPLPLPCVTGGASAGAGGGGAHPRCRGSAAPPCAPPAAPPLCVGPRAGSLPCRAPTLQRGNPKSACSGCRAAGALAGFRSCRQGRPGHRRRGAALAASRAALPRAPDPRA